MADETTTCPQIFALGSAGFSGGGALGGAGAGAAATGGGAAAGAGAAGAPVSGGTPEAWVASSCFEHAAEALTTNASARATLIPRGFVMGGT